MGPKISVIIPMYNTQAYVTDCLDSLARQSFWDFEAIVVDDASTDKSAQVVQEIADRDERFLLFTHPVNKGAGGARNTGIKHAQGEYIAFLDSDDQFAPDALATMLSCIERTGADMVIGKMNVRTERGEEPVRYVDQVVNRLLLMPKENVRDIVAEQIYTGALVNRLYRTEFLHKNGVMFLENIMHEEDVPFSLETWFHAKNIGVLPQTVYVQSARQQAQATRFPQKAFADRDICLNYVYAFGKENATMRNDARALSLTVLEKMYNTTARMVPLADEEIREEIEGQWWPDYTKRMKNAMMKLRLRI